MDWVEPMSPQLVPSLEIDVANEFAVRVSRYQSGKAIVAYEGWLEELAFNVEREPERIVLAAGCINAA
jgi:hypothetical protein